MNRLTKLQIEKALLAGEAISWLSAAGKRESIKLDVVAQRRLLAYLLKSNVREAKGLPDNFLSDLSKLRVDGPDPAVRVDANAGGSLQDSWRLRKLETEGFGGLNSYGGKPFELDLGAESFVFQGPNGSGKSSLVGAILWALTGERPRENADGEPSERMEVFDAHNQKIGTWPPIASYPSSRLGLLQDPFVRVTLTFTTDAGEVSIVERILKGGQVTSRIDGPISIPDVLIETGLLMPSRMSRIRFEKGPTPLTQAVRSLTGLDDLIDVGLLIEGLCHKAREYLSTHQKQLVEKEEQFDTVMAEVHRVLLPTRQTVRSFRPTDTADQNGEFAELGRALRQRAAELTQAIADDLNSGLDLTDAQTQTEVAGAISGATEEIQIGLSQLDTWKLLAELVDSTSNEQVDGIRAAVTKAESDLQEALSLDERAKLDNRLRLKAIAARWHETHRGGEIHDCPVCDRELDDDKLRAELDALRSGSDSLGRQLNDNVNAIEASLTNSMPSSVSAKLPTFATLLPRKKLVEEICERFVSRQRYAKTLATFTATFRQATIEAPLAEVVPLNPSAGVKNATERLLGRIASVKQLLILRTWFVQNSQSWQTWWSVLIGAGESAVESAAQEGIENSNRSEPLRKHLARLTRAVSDAAPYRSAADALGRAWKIGREAHRLQVIQEEREAIAKLLSPLKSLGALADAQARIAIETLSLDIAVILGRIHVTERLEFAKANFQRRSGLEVQATLSEGVQIDATLVANTSWLRSVLWAFLFALRNEAVKQLGRDVLPILLFDDPQATFDAEHRHRWALEIVNLQSRATGAQVLITTYDEVFSELLKIDGIKAREAVIVSAGPELEHLGVFEGAALDRLWGSARKSSVAAAGQDYIGAVRIYLEGLLRLMLRGYAADVNLVGHGLVVGAAREKIRELHAAGISPWDKSEFSTLVAQLNGGNPAIKFIEISHHASRGSLGMGEAKTVEEYWRKYLGPSVRRAFQLAREHQILHGGLKALRAAAPNCSLPEGYSDKVRALRLPVLGRAAALTGGESADGRLELDLLSTSSQTVVFGKHFAFRLNAPTLEPVARTGDVLLVRVVGEPSSRSLVVARYEDRVVARRFEIADNFSDIAVLTAQAVNPRQIASPIIAQRATLELQKVIGILFDHGRGMATPGEEVCDCGGESAIQQYVGSVRGLVEVVGDSAEPIALNGQMLMIGERMSAKEALAKLDGQPVIAGNMADERFFKRLRYSGGEIVVLESLEISGDFPPIVCTVGTGASTDLVEVWPVYGVLFESP